MRRPTSTRTHSRLGSCATLARRGLVARQLTAHLLHRTREPMEFKAKDGDKFWLSENWWRVRIDLEAADPKHSCGFYIPQDLLRPIGEWLIAAADADLNPNTNGALERMGLAQKWHVAKPGGEQS